MKRRLKEPFGKAGLLVAAIALVFAMLGGAYAASNSGSGNATASAKAKKGPRGPKGPKGDPGAPGAAGKDGTNGTNGTNGKDGAEGKQGPEGKPGTNGTNGKSVAVTTIASGGAKCEGRAGAEVKQEGAATATEVCNGKDGQTGFTETLPSGKTETGVWGGAGYSLPNASESRIPISFSIPLEEGGEAFRLDPGETNSGAGTGGCTGTLVHPTAPAGVLCLYTAEEQTEGGFFFGATNFNLESNVYGPTGTTVLFGVFEEAGGHFKVYGTFAVTAP